jgi:hypothetical protein
LLAQPSILRYRFPFPFLIVVGIRQVAVFRSIGKGIPKRRYVKSGAFQVLPEIFLFPFGRAYLVQKICLYHPLRPFTANTKQKTADLTDAAEKKSHGKEKR